MYNIQGHLRDASFADSECGELVIFRILNEHMSDKDFADYCLKLGGFQIFQFIKCLTIVMSLLLYHTQKRSKNIILRIIYGV
jgi:hypothetical protein